MSRTIITIRGLSSSSLLSCSNKIRILYDNNMKCCMNSFSIISLINTLMCLQGALGSKDWISLNAYGVSENPWTKGIVWLDTFLLVYLLMFHNTNVCLQPPMHIIILIALIVRYTLFNSSSTCTCTNLQSILNIDLCQQAAAGVKLMKFKYCALPLIFSAAVNKLQV